MELTPGELAKLEKQKIIDFYHSFIASHRYSPNFNEIAVGIGREKRDRGNIYKLVHQLIKQGWLYEAGEGRSRTIYPVEPPPRARYVEDVEEEEKEGAK